MSRDAFGWALSAVIALTPSSPVGGQSLRRPAPILETLVGRQGAARGPLRVSRQNPHYFETPSGEAVYLTGSHTWSNLQDNGTSDPPAPFDYASYLTFLREHGHNFFRLWAWEQLKWTAEIQGDYWFDPVPFLRTGPGLALDGKPRVDLTRFDPGYFARMSDRVRLAQAAGIYVSVMLFDGWSLGIKGTLNYDNPWRGHPMNASNNINGIDGDLNHDGFGYEVETLARPEITAIQEAYVRRVVNAVNEFDNVLYEISNEGDTSSVAWQLHMIDFLKRYEAGKPKQHPVGMSSIWPDGNNADLLGSEADWIAPNGDAEDRPAASPAKVILSDTDHLCGTCGSINWVWQSFTRGENPVFMDGYDGAAMGVGAGDYDRDDPRWEEIRLNLGYARALAERVPLAAMVPRPDLASTGFCLAATSIPHPVYVVYLQGSRPVMVDLSANDGSFQVAWLDPASGLLTESGAVRGGATRTLAPPSAGPMILFLH